MPRRRQQAQVGDGSEGDPPARPAGIVERTLIETQRRQRGQALIFAKQTTIGSPPAHSRAHGRPGIGGGIGGVRTAGHPYAGFQEAAAAVDTSAAEEAIGFVYLLKANRYFKIGRSSSFERRSRELAIQLPERAETVHVIRTDDPIGIELYWHRRFESKRKNGEWFELSAKDVKAFKRRKFM